MSIFLFGDHHDDDDHHDGDDHHDSDDHYDVDSFTSVQKRSGPVKSCLGQNVPPPLISDCLRPQVKAKKVKRK